MKRLRYIFVVWLICFVICFLVTTWIRGADARVVPCPVCEPVEHEACHELHARLRGQYGSPAVYVGDGQAVVIPEVRGFRLTDLARAIPERLRGPVYNLYLRQQARWWDAQPSYVFDEWASYLNGTEWHRRNNPGNAAYSLERAREMQRYAGVLVAKAKAAGGDSRPLEQVYERLSSRTELLFAKPKAKAPYRPELKPCIVAVSSSRCLACRDIRPLWKSLEAVLPVTYVDLDRPPEWAKGHKVTVVPLTCYFVGGKLRGKWTGADAQMQTSIADTVVPTETPPLTWPAPGAPAPEPRKK